MLILSAPIQFEWNKGNIDKNFIKHSVSNTECEEIFFDKNKIILKDLLHSGKELRFVILGKTKKGRLLFSIFTLRKNKIRIISSRDINKKKLNYMKKELKLKKFKSEDEERNFWSKIDLSEYFEIQDFEKVSFPNLKPTTRSISLRLPEYIIVQAKEKANQMNVPYQSLIKKYIAEGLNNR